MRRTQLIAIPAAAAVMLTGACGHSSSSSSSGSSNTQSAAAGQQSGSSSGASASNVDCPTSNTRKFAKTRFVTDVGLAAGTFHRYLYKPYQAGTFKKGADGRIKAMAKGAATAALDVKLLSNAEKNVKANPTLCKTLAKPLADATQKIKDSKGDIAKGNFGSLMAANGLLSQIESKSKDSGNTITESTDESKASDS